MAWSVNTILSGVHLFKLPRIARSPTSSSLTVLSLSSCLLCTTRALGHPSCKLPCVHALALSSAHTVTSDPSRPSSDQDPLTKDDFALRKAPPSLGQKDSEFWLACLSCSLIPIADLSSSSLCQVVRSLGTLALNDLPSANVPSIHLSRTT
jgi:hypothetical protein